MVAGGLRGELMLGLVCDDLGVSGAAWSGVVGVDGAADRRVGPGFLGRGRPGRAIGRWGTGSVCSWWGLFVWVFGREMAGR